MRNNKNRFLGKNTMEYRLRKKFPPDDMNEIKKIITVMTEDLDEARKSISDGETLINRLKKAAGQIVKIDTKVEIDKIDKILKKLKNIEERLYIKRKKQVKDFYEEKQKLTNEEIANLKRIREEIAALVKVLTECYEKNQEKLKALTKAELEKIAVLKPKMVELQKRLDVVNIRIYEIDLIISKIEKNNETIKNNNLIINNIIKPKIDNHITNIANIVIGEITKLLKEKGKDALNNISEQEIIKSTEEFTYSNSKRLASGEDCSAELAQHCISRLSDEQKHELGDDTKELLQKLLQKQAQQFLELGKTIEEQKNLEAENKVALEENKGLGNLEELREEKQQLQNEQVDLIIEIENTRIEIGMAVGVVLDKKPEIVELEAAKEMARIEAVEAEAKTAEERTAKIENEGDDLDSELTTQSPVPQNK